MRGIEKDLIKAANNLGAGPVPAFLRVYFPLSLPGVVSGFTLVFIMSLGFFITPALLGGLGDIMISMLIESNVNEFLNWGLASALSVTLLSLTGLAFVLFKLLARGFRVGSAGSGSFFSGT
jgi:ABC-type spermidine/putrescine transport system permease subunit I